MISKGTDAISRGLLGEGVTTGDDMLSFIPLDESAFDRSAMKLKAWIQVWMGPKVEGNLQPEGWFECGHNQIGGELDSQGHWLLVHKSGTFIWAPPSAAADVVALEELWKARIKRQDSLHIVVIPHLPPTHPQVALPTPQSV
jgi:hypothetical protein